MNAAKILWGQVRLISTVALAFVWAAIESVAWAWHSSLSSAGPGSRYLVGAKARIDQANGDTRVEPTRAGYVNAIQVHPFADGVLYQVYAALADPVDSLPLDQRVTIGNGGEKPFALQREDHAILHRRSPGNDRDVNDSIARPGGEPLP
jgi:hypothetical protein